MKVLITGSSSVGKSTTIAELARRGLDAIDSDEEPGLCQLVVKASGEVAQWPSGFVDWSIYSWNWKDAQLRAILERSSDVFIGAINGNQDKYYELFDTIIVLTLPPEVHRQRLYGRPKRPQGDGEENIQDRIQKYPILLQRFLDSGAVPVDASGTPSEVADGVLRASGFQAIV